MMCDGRCSSRRKQPTAGFVTHVTCRLTAKNRDQLRNPTLGSRAWASCVDWSRRGVGQRGRAGVRDTDSQERRRALRCSTRRTWSTDPLWSDWNRQDPPRRPPSQAPRPPVCISASVVVLGLGLEGQVLVNNTDLRIAHLCALRTCSI